jgi:hypothetical protein
MLSAACDSPVTGTLVSTEALLGREEERAGLRYFQSSLLNFHLPNGIFLMQSVYSRKALFATSSASGVSFNIPLA